MTGPYSAAPAPDRAEMARPDLCWLLDDLVGRVGGVDRAVVLSADGLLLARSSSVAHEDAEQLSAIGSAFHSLARGAARQFAGGPVQQTVVETDSMFLFVTAAGPGACLAILAEADADIGVVAYETGLLVRRVGSVLSAPPRSGG
jgi:predicted regulator of Ras-like GTPase activity (Roadblock/LC7/MglB family)